MRLIAVQVSSLRHRHIPGIDMDELTAVAALLSKSGQNDCRPHSQ